MHGSFPNIAPNAKKRIAPFFFRSSRLTSRGCKIENIFKSVLSYCRICSLDNKYLNYLQLIAAWFVIEFTVMQVSFLARRMEVRFIEALENFGLTITWIKSYQSFYLVSFTIKLTYLGLGLSGGSFVSCLFHNLFAKVGFSVYSWWVELNRSITVCNIY